jgi:flagella basal body P-ring formation protein FlgA
MTLRTLTLAAAFAAVLSGPALAGTVSLKAQPGFTDGGVTLGGLFDGAGSASRVVVATARPGANLVLDAARVQQVARANGLDWANEQGVRRIIVRSAAAQMAGNRDVLTYARNINAGDIVQPEDLVWGKALGAPVDAPRNPEAVIGKAARRPLSAGGAVALRDITTPLVIKKDDVVSVAFEEEGVRLVLQAKAMGGAAMGDSVSLMNPGSKKIIQATAIGPDEAVVGPSADRLKAAGQQFASLR